MHTYYYTTLIYIVFKVYPLSLNIFMKLLDKQKKKISCHYLAFVNNPKYLIHDVLF